MQFDTPIPFIEHLGVELLHQETGHVVTALSLRPELENSWHVAHGGVTMTRSLHEKGACQMARYALDGLRVLDLSRVLAGPFCAMMLGDHGADIIKVEPPDGDETRTYGPPFVEGHATYYMGLNRNKRGIVLDLARPEAQEAVRRLVQTSDVLIENFKTGTMERWGLGYEHLRQINPRLVYCAVSGFGRTGPYANLPGYDAILQAMGGLMSVTGEAGGQPIKAGVALCDLATGLFANQAILLALHHRTATGAGQRVEVSLLETVTALLHPYNTNYLNAGVVGKPVGNSHPSISPYDVIHAADRPIYLGVGNDGQFRRLGALIGMDLLGDPRFGSNKARVEHRQELLEILGQVFRTRPAMEWCRELWAAGVPAGPVNDVAAVFADPQVLHRGMVQEIAHPVLGQVRLPGIPIKLEAAPGAIRRHPPLKGEHTIEVLREIGYSEAEIAHMLAREIAG